MTQTTTPLGRAKLEHPDLGFDTEDIPPTPKGTALHTAILNIWTQVANHLPSRWTGSITLLNANSVNVIHNFNLALAKLDLFFFVAGNQLTDVQVAANFNITQVSLDQISIQNISGGSLTFHVLIFACKALTAWPSVNVNTINEKTLDNGVLIDGVTLKDNAIICADVTLSSLTASSAIFTDTNKKLVSKAITGSGSVVLDITPTITTPVFSGNSTGTIAGGTYEPTFTNEAQLSSFSNINFMYIRVGNVVKVTGKFSATSSGGSNDTCYITLPVTPATFGSKHDAIGICSSQQVSYPMIAKGILPLESEYGIYSESGGTRARMQTPGTNSGAKTFTVDFMYKLT